MTGQEAWAHSTGPLGKIEHDWRPDPAIKSVISLNFDFHAGDNFVSWSPSARIEVREGKKCIVGAYIMFDVDERFAFDTDETIIVDLTFYRPETDGFVLSYDQAVKPTAMQVRFDANSDNSSWHTETVRLERARFANRKYYGTDLAIGGIGSQLTHPEGRGEAVLCAVKLRREALAPPPPSPQGTISLKVVDENGKPTAARVGIYRTDGWAPLAGADAIMVQRYTEYTRELPMVSVPRGWSQNGRYAFFVDGKYESSVPEGAYQLLVMKGPEYRIHKSEITIESGEKQSVHVNLERFDDLPQRGWLSGDDHIHISRPSSAKNDSILAFMKAEDIRVANLLQASNLKGLLFEQYAFGEAGVFGGKGYFLVSGQESPRTAHRGHTIGLNTTRFFWPDGDYFFYDTSSDHIRADGGLWGYAHVALDAFNLHYGLALDVPRGKVDFLEMLQYGLMNTSYLYDFLNMGFKLLPSAGSDYPYIDFPGAERVYVHLDNPVSSKSWFQALKSSRSFVTNWMSADFTINGDSSAVEYDIQSGELVAVEAVVRVNPDFDQLDRVELVALGDVLQMVPAKEGASELKLSHSFAPAVSMWLAIRAYGKGGALLHTAPVYLYVDGDRDFSNCEKVAELAQKYHDVLLEFRESTPRLDVEFERFAVEDLILPRWEEAKPVLDAAIGESIAIYDDLILARSCGEKDRQK
jgi:hypothetical protein